MLKWEFFGLRDLLIIGAIVLLTRFAFYKAVNALDGKSDDATQ